MLLAVARRPNPTSLPIQRTGRSSRLPACVAMRVPVAFLPPGDDATAPDVRILILRRSSSARSGSSTT
jgi:hypothetical protein